MSATLTRHVDGAARFRTQLAHGAATTVHVAAYAARRSEVNVAVLRRPEPLSAWCARRGVEDALVGGFLVREPEWLPLGEVRTRGVERRHVPFDERWADERACVHVEAGRVRLAPRSEICPRPRGDLLHAGPMLVSSGKSLVAAGDPEGFSAGSHQFDSDITDGRHPRAALGVAAGVLLAVVCDGRSHDDAGLTLAELAELMLDLGAEYAINLDGGGSASLVCAGVLANTPREQHGVEIPAGRPVSTAITFRPR